MDPVSTALGLAASLTGLVQFAADLLGLISKHLVLGNEDQMQHLWQMLQDIKLRFESARGVYSQDVVEELEATFEELKATFSSIKNPCPRCPSVIGCIWSCLRASTVSAKLDEAERKLENLRSQVLIVEGVLTLSKPLATIYNENVELPSSDVGLSRAQLALEFLQKSEQQELRVIGIYGQPGVGKTTILDKIWADTSAKPPFVARAYVQVGHDATPESLRKLQSSILEQLGGSKMDFPSEGHGKEKLREHFEALQKRSQAIFLALDNVWNPEDLSNLLPSKLSALPHHSCIALTSRDLAVVEALLRMSHIQKGNKSKAHVYMPDFLSLEDSKALFRNIASIENGEHVELVEALVGLCGGLPLALKLVGGIFIDEAQREEKEWKSLVKQFEEYDMERSDLRQEMSPLWKHLELSYERLDRSHKAAWLDIVHFFYGWPWSRVERIVGSSILKVLRSRCLISEAMNYRQCNQTALRRGYNFYLDDYEEVKVVVAMHDLTLKFGEGLHSQDVWHEEQDLCESPQMVSNFLEKCASHSTKLRNLILFVPDSMKIHIEQLQFLSAAVNLRMLILHKFDLSGPIILRAGKDYFDSAPVGLSFLGLEGWDSSGFNVMEMTLSSATREIYIEGCDDIMGLPNIPLRYLESLRIVHFREQFGTPRKHLNLKHVNEWKHLKKFRVEGWDCELPDELLKLPFLEVLICSHIRSLPSCIGNAHSLKHLDCDCLQAVELPTGMEQLTSLKSLRIRRAWNLERIHSGIGRLTGLERLDLRCCPSLEELPDEIGQMTSLQWLSVSDCENLKRMPASIGQLVNLRVLRVGGCRSLVRLPDEMAHMRSLKFVDVSGCDKLERLPTGPMERMWARWCPSLLTVHMGQIACLRDLDLSHCRNLRRIPATLPRELVVNVEGCEKLKRIPSSI